jgi:flagellar hook protein FlgE
MPSILNGLFSGRAGLQSHGLAISVVGDNLSNASTIGFKSSRTEFQDLVSAGQPAGKTVGSGTQVGNIVPIQEQGTLEFTGRSLDVAIEGSGYFIARAGDGNVYSRAGNFQVDEDGFLVTQQGDSVLGFRHNGTGGLESLNVSSVLQENVASTEVGIEGNLDAQPLPVAISGTVNGTPLAANVVGGTTTPAATDPTFSDLNDEAEFSTVVGIYDSLGQEHNVSLYFFRESSTAPQYTVRAYAQSEDVDPSVVYAGRPRQLGGGTPAVNEVQLSFNSDGTMSTTSDRIFNLNIPWNNGSTSQVVDIDLSGFSQFASPSSISSVTQDGQGVGSVTSLNIGVNGEIFAVLDTARTASIGTLALANFFNPEGLRRIGENYLQESNDSGEPIVGVPDTGRFGTIQSGSLELSTVDIANEFVKLVTLQRAFQANSRMVTTVNGLLNDIIQLV